MAEKQSHQTICISRRCSKSSDIDTGTQILYHASLIKTTHEFNAATGWSDELLALQWTAQH